MYIKTWLEVYAIEIMLNLILYNEPSFKYQYQHHIENNWINTVSKVYGGQCICTA